MSKTRLFFVLTWNEITFFSKDEEINIHFKNDQSLIYEHFFFNLVPIFSTWLYDPTLFIYTQGS